jgi:cytoskeletal protein CcmA (bactofilin family)
MFGSKKNDLPQETSQPEEPYEVQVEESVMNTQIEEQPETNSYAQEKEVNFFKPSVISEGFEFRGEIKSNGPLTVDGKMNGSITVENLTIGINGEVEGVIVAKSVNVKGKLTGEIFCNEIIVGSRSSVDGQLTYSSITIQRGGLVRGKLQKNPT